MDKFKYKILDEDIYFKKLPNGLEVYLYSKKNINNNYVTFTTKYGSIYNEFVPLGETKLRKFPKGIAHFLEHKVFEQECDPQPMDFYAKTGSICNAYTTFENTSYLFYATSSIKDNINYLLDFVQNIYLTEESVEEEKKIITEEIHMYEDNPNAVLEERLRENVLKSSMFRDSIIAKVEDITKITKEDLETCYHTFYHPSNMFLVATGNFNVEEVMESIRENQANKEFKKASKVEVTDVKEEDKVVKEIDTVYSSTGIPKIAYTIKIPLKDINLTRREMHLYMFILFSCLFDETSLFDEYIKNNNISSKSTGISMLDTRSHLLVTLSNSTNKYNEYIDKLKEELSNINIKEEDFNRKKKILVSNEVLAFEDIELINDIITSDILDDGKINLDPIGTINNLNYKKLLDLINIIDFNNKSIVILKNKENA